jgi:hypothetical protein
LVVLVGAFLFLMRLFNSSCLLLALFIHHRVRNNFRFLFLPCLLRSLLNNLNLLPRPLPVCRLPSHLILFLLPLPLRCFPHNFLLFPLPFLFLLFPQHLKLFFRPPSFQFLLLLPHPILFLLQSRLRLAISLLWVPIASIHIAYNAVLNPRIILRDDRQIPQQRIRCINIWIILQVGCYC